MNGHVQPAELAEDLGYLAPLRLRFVGSTISGPENLRSVVAGDTELGWAFNGVIASGIASKAPIRAVVGYYGIDDLRQSAFFVLKDSPIHDAGALLGKQVAVNLLGAHSEFIAKEYLFRGGLSRGEVRQVALVAVPQANGEQALRQKQVDVAALYDTHRERALERGSLRLLFSDYDLFGAITAGSYVMRRDFIGNNLNTARHFVSAVARAIEWSREAPREEVVERFESIIERRGRDEDVSDVKHWGSYGVAARGGVISEREFQIWIDWLVKDGGLERGQLSATDLFDNDLNPFVSSTAAPLD
jgi:ABC-type nitrate/sulfonate/bicarbonate transport system substrate-binding protein